MQTEKLASLGQLTAGIAHEIKNPLNFVNNFSAVSVELIEELRQALAGATLNSKVRAEIGDIADTLQDNLERSCSTASVRIYRQKHVVAFARGLRGAPADGCQRPRPGEPESRLSQRAG